MRWTNSINQFRFVVRMAHACHVAGVPYDLTWSIGKGRATACLEALLETCRIAKRSLPKKPRAKLVSEWKPSMRGQAFTYRLLEHSVPLMERLETSPWRQDS